MNETYATTLNAGLGMTDETKIMLELWQPGMSTTDLLQVALESGRFPKVTARRLRNFIVEGFARCYLTDEAAPAVLLQRLVRTLPGPAFTQLLFLFNCRTHRVLADFVRDVYWRAYVAGRPTLSNEEARLFVQQARRDGKTSTPWSESSIARVGRYLTGYAAEFGLLEGGAKQVRRILPYRIDPRVAAILAYDLHFKGHGDASILTHSDWQLFGMEREDVLEETKRMTLKRLMIVQSAGGVTRISWTYKTMEELTNVLAPG